MAFMYLTLAMVFVIDAAGHGTLTKPLTRNRGPLDQKGPSDYQSGNGGGKGFDAGFQNGNGASPCGDGIWGFSNNQGGGGIGWHYRGGDAAGAPLHAAWKRLLAQYNPDLQSDLREEYTQGHHVEVQAQITAYHGGYMTFHLCPVAHGDLDFDVEACGLLAPAGSDDHTRHLLRNLTSASLPPPSQFCTNCEEDSTSAGFCGYNPGCEGAGPDGYAVMSITLEAPQVAMDHGVLVWHWFTGNNGAGFVGGEEFMNCADVRILPASGVRPPLPAATPAPATAAPETPAPATPAPATPAPETPAPGTPAPATPAAATPTPATPTVVAPTPANGECDGALGGAFSAYSCSDSWINVGQCAHADICKTCCVCKDDSCHDRLSQTNVGTVQSHQFLAARGSSMMEQWAERDEQDQLLVETDGPQDEL